MREIDWRSREKKKGGEKKVWRRKKERENINIKGEQREMRNRIGIEKNGVHMHELSISSYV